MVDIREARGSASELKFLLDPSRGEQVREWARARLEPDPHGAGPCDDEYLTSSLYFDTGEWDVFHRRGSFGKAKYRIRRYGGVDVVFLERKLRTSKMVVKRRTMMPIGVLDDLEQRTELDRTWPGGWFHRRLIARGLRPVCVLSYQRMARVTLVDGFQARLTLDDRVRVAAVARAHFNGQAGLPVLEDQLILELKFRGHLPAVFRGLIGEFKLAASPASKYRFGMTALGDLPTGVEPFPRKGAHA
jgi:VTC domain